MEDNNDERKKSAQVTQDSIDVYKAPPLLLHHLDAVLYPPLLAGVSNLPINAKSLIGVEREYGEVVESVGV
ncbi:hypothetical protein COLO4_27225 [Corchorus olitorius]|uniref:Uncharacterized protein n=1 Tax=Corchorus olitorius TaxID=93759 RepID=A0A1R3HS79_9ROSI|nr:hypothetical protein COLO4_27225 [Corchorus olitorius]